MVYEKDKIRRLINYKDKQTEGQLKNDLEWIVEFYNKYFANNREYEYQSKEYKKILNKYYNAEEEKERLKEELRLIKRKYRRLKESCGNSKSMI